MSIKKHGRRTGISSVLYGGDLGKTKELSQRLSHHVLPIDDMHREHNQSDPNVFCGEACRLGSRMRLTATYFRTLNGQNLDRTTQPPSRPDEAYHQRADESLGKVGTICMSELTEWSHWPDFNTSPRYWAKWDEHNRDGVQNCWYGLYNPSGLALV